MSGPDIAHSLEALAAALESAGAAAMREPADPAVLDRIDAAIAPLRLPAAVRSLWESVDPESISAHHHPGLTSPEFALETWESHINDFPGSVPHVLFPIGYESHCHLLVELDGADLQDGGAIFAWEYGAVDFRLVFPDPGQMLDHLTSSVMVGRYKRHSDHLYITGESLVTAAPAPVIHPVFGPIDTIPEDISQWPEVWRLRSGLTPERREPAGADRTIAEVLLESQFGPTQARIHATVTQLAGGAAGINVTVTDGSGTMRIWCPTGVTALGPKLNSRFEFHIKAPPDGAPDPPDWEAALSDPKLADLPMDLGPIAARLTDATAPADAIATDIRPTEQG